MSYLFGINSTILGENEENLLKTCDLYGIVLFSRNIQSPEQVKYLIKDIKNKLGNSVKICVDQEGGRVQRINFTQKYPSSLEFSQKFQQENSAAEEFMQKNVENMSRELKTLGFDINFAPVLDLFYKVETNLISDRSYGENPDFVSKMCEKFIKFSQNEGIECVLKHIPGHGRANIDSHLDLPVITADLAQLNQMDFVPFVKLSPICKLAMTAHVIFTALDAEKPFTISKKAIDYIKNLCPGVKIMTDAIEMGALVKFYNKNLESQYSNVNFYEKSTTGKQELLEILAKIASQCQNSGCDITMHCSGNFEEMRAILQKI